MSLLAATSNIALTYQPGVRYNFLVSRFLPNSSLQVAAFSLDSDNLQVLGESMHPKAKVTDGGYVRDAQWGCWRGHADTWRRVIDEKLETALILEDDIDWDVNVHAAFHELSKTMRRGKLRKKRMDEEERSRAPYGKLLLS
jgi:GR25 family glycosyltransferase involved in LPS biosynthesis